MATHVRGRVDKVFDLWPHAICAPLRLGGPCGAAGAPSQLIADPPGDLTRGRQRRLQRAASREAVARRHGHGPIAEVGR